VLLVVLLSGWAGGILRALRVVPLLFVGLGPQPPPRPVPIRKVTALVAEGPVLD